MTERIEYGVEWRYSTGRSFIGAAVSLAGARRMVHFCGDPKAYSPHAVRVVQRAAAEWLPVPLQPEGKTQATK